MHASLCDAIWSDLMWCDALNIFLVQQILDFVCWIWYASLCIKCTQYLSCSTNTCIFPLDLICIFLWCTQYLSCSTNICICLLDLICISLWCTQIEGVPIIPTNIFPAGASAMLSLSLNISQLWRWVVVARGVNVFGDSVKGEMVLVNPGPNPFVPLRQTLPRSDDDDDFSAQKEEKPKQVKTWF